MIKTLKKKFIFTAMIAVSVLILILLGTINIANIVMVKDKINRTIDIIAQNETMEGFIDSRPDTTPPMRKDIFKNQKDEHDTFLSATFFTVRYDPNGNVIGTDTSRIASVNEKEAIQMSREIYESGNVTGKISKFRYIVCETRLENGKIVIFVDTSEEIYSYIRILLLSAGIGILCWGLMLVFVILLSEKAIEPIAENIEKQKQFVTNAGHEIKTPLAIIRANTEAMELYNGENKWSKNIKDQVVRLGDLMNDMLSLARMDEISAAVSISEFSISALLENSLGEYAEPFEAKSIQIIRSIAPNIIVSADKELIGKLFSIMLDNALKYTDENGTFRVSLYEKDKKTHIIFENTCENLPDIAPNKLFERFYRADESRSRESGGYGIGLSVARSIVDANNGNITADYRKPDTIIFKISLG